MSALLRATVATTAAILLVAASVTAASAATVSTGSKSCSTTYNIQKSTSGAGTVTHKVESDEFYGEHTISYYSTSSQTRTTR